MIVAAIVVAHELLDLTFESASSLAQQQAVRHKATDHNGRPQKQTLQQNTQVAIRFRHSKLSTLNRP